MYITSRVIKEICYIFSAKLSDTRGAITVPKAILVYVCSSQVLLVKVGIILETTLILEYPCICWGSKVNKPANAAYYPRAL